MQLNLKRIFCTSTILLLTISFTYADADSALPDLSIPSLESRLVCLEQEFGINGITNPPGMPLTRNGWDFQISADALLWQVQEDGLIYGVETVSTGFPIGAHSLKQKYNWGFRIGLDWTLPHDNWDIAVNWTHLVSNRHGKHTAGPSNVLTKTQGYITDNRLDFEPEDIGFYTTIGNSKYHNRLDQISLNLGREFFISKWVTLRPFFGLRADWLHQRLHTSYSGITEVPPPPFPPTSHQTAHQSNKWWGIGIESGLNTQLNFCGGFSLYGNIATAIEYGLQKLSLKESGIVVFPFRNSYHICRPILDLQLGLGWDYNFCEDAFHLGLKLGWENHVYFDQSRFLSYNTVNYSDNQSGGSLTYQGWTLHACFDF
ncbi:MAG: Lpg1974 family pore-forming outer membrane protein [Candidatus Rhabdochlamydia sp.]